MSVRGKLYLIPVGLGDSDLNQVIPENNKEIINGTDVYIVENIKSARRFLKKAGLIKAIDELTFFELNKRTDPADLSSFLKPLESGNNVGVLSEAGCPGVADPGAEIVALAQQKGYTVVPLVGPSSILLSLMGSGMNGQSFCFHGYLPKDQKERIHKLKELERAAIQLKQTQLFIETPYRNTHVFEDLLKNCGKHTRLCIAVDITLATEQITTKSIENWRKTKINLQKRPCIFLLGH